MRYVVRPAPEFKPINVGLRKRATLSAIRTKHKASLDVLPCVSKQFPYGRGNSNQQHLNEITKNKRKQGKEA